MTHTALGEQVPLWPTWIGQIDLPGAEEFKSEFERLAESATHKDNMIWMREPCAKWLTTWVDKALRQWLIRERISVAISCDIRLTMDVLRFGQYRELHNVPGSYLSGIYFVNKPEIDSNLRLRSDAWPSHLSLYDPRVGFNANALKGDPNFDENRTLESVPGQLILWPGYVRTHSRVHLGRSPWIRVKVDVNVSRASSGS